MIRPKRPPQTAHDLDPFVMEEASRGSRLHVLIEQLEGISKTLMPAKPTDMGENVVCVLGIHPLPKRGKGIFKRLLIKCLTSFLMLSVMIGNGAALSIKGVRKDLILTIKPCPCFLSLVIVFLMTAPAMTRQRISIDLCQDLVTERDNLEVILFAGFHRVSLG